MRIVLLSILLCSSSLFSQEMEKDAHLAFKIRNEMGEVFKGSILLIANNRDTIPITANWNNVFRIDLLPGTYRLVLKNKLFDDYRIGTLSLARNETKELDIIWKHRNMVLPQIVFHL